MHSGQAIVIAILLLAEAIPGINMLATVIAGLTGGDLLTIAMLAIKYINYPATIGSDFIDIQTYANKNPS